MKDHKPPVHVFERSFEALDPIFAHADAFFSANDVDPQASFALKLAVEEIFTNFVKYNPEGSSGITIDMQRDDDTIVVTLVDSDSPRFDVTEFDRADTSSALEERTPGGLGLFLVKKMVDDVQYHHSDRISTIVLTKKMSR